MRLSLLFFLCLGCCLHAQSDRPNILLINVDDVGYGDLGPYGQQLIKTPRIDRLVAEGLRFTAMYAGAPVCGPSRASLLTARHAGRIGSCNNGQANLSTFPSWVTNIRDAGYATALIGKQHKAELNGETVVGDSPRERGFQESYGWLNAVDAHQHFVDGETITPGWQRRQYLFGSNGEGTTIRQDISPDRYVQNEFRDRALTYLEDHQDEPFLLYLPFTIAHAELIVPRPGDPDFSPADSGLLEQYLDAEGNSIFPEFDYRGDNIYGRPNPFLTRATYAAMLSRLDRDIGLILDKLDSLGIAENTLVILTSDNGPADEGGVDPQQIDGNLDSPFNSNGGLVGFKRSLHEGGIRIPFLLRWPGTIAAGTTTEVPLAQYDVGPTLLDILNLDPLPEADGRSFFPLLQDQPLAERPPLYFQFGSQQAARSGKWKLYRGQNTSPNDSLALFNLEVDPGETTNLTGAAYDSIRYALLQVLNAGAATSTCGYIPLDTTTTVNPGGPPRPAFDDFDYPPGTSPTGQGDTTGGWRGPWELVGGTDGGRVRLGGLGKYYPAENATARLEGNRLEVDFTTAGGSRRINRRLAQPYPDDGSVYWLGGWWQMESGTEDRNVYQWLLTQPELFGPSGPNGQPFRFGKEFGRADLGFSGGPYLDLPADSTYFLVFRIQTSGDAAADRVDVFIDPPLSEEPLLAESALTTNLSLNEGFGGLGLKTEGRPSFRAEADDLRLGLNYLEVVSPRIRLTTGTRETAEELGFRVYPNPAKRTLHLRAAPAYVTQRYRYALLANDGKEVMAGRNKGDSTLHLPVLASGIYWLRIMMRARKQVLPVVVH